MQFIGSGNSNSNSAGALNIPQKWTFVSTATRDSYFTTNKIELKNTKTLIAVGNPAVMQKWIGTDSPATYDNTKWEIQTNMIRGEKGTQGIQGIQGIKGDTGVQGIQGLTGLTGSQGIQGVQGIRGNDGSGNVFLETLPIVANRINNTFYWLYAIENGVKVFKYVENHLGDRFDITGDMAQKIATMQDLVNGVIDADITAVLNSQLVATDIANKLLAKEVEYAPRLANTELALENNETRLDNISDRVKRNANKSLYIPTYDGTNQTVHPSVVYSPTPWNGFRYWMAHTPYPSAIDVVENPSIVCSGDGVSWRNPTGLANPIDQPTSEQIALGYHMSDTHLILKNNVLECYYRLTCAGVIDQLMRKTSTNGVTWSEREVIHEVFDNDMTLSPAIIYDGTIYQMWYVSNGVNYPIIYKESITGALGTWSVGQTVSLAFAEGESPKNPWHLDVMQDGTKYYLILLVFDGDTKKLMIGESTNKINFTGIKTILERSNPNELSRFDNHWLYRASLIKVGTLFKLYYSARSIGNIWRVGVVVGTSPYNMYPTEETVSETGDMVDLRNVQIRDGSRLFLDDKRTAYVKPDLLKLTLVGQYGAGLKLTAGNELSILTDALNLLGNLRMATLYATSVIMNPSSTAKLTQSSLKLVVDGLYAASIKTTALNQLTIFADNNTSLGDLILANLMATNITTGWLKGVPTIESGYVSVDQKMQLKGSATNPIHLKFLNALVAGAGIVMGGQANTLKIVNDGNTASGSLEVSSIICLGDGVVPTKEGAIRYNYTTKKHQGYNGTAWFDMY